MWACNVFELEYLPIASFNHKSNFNANQNKVHITRIKKIHLRPTLSMELFKSRTQYHELYTGKVQHQNQLWTVTSNRDDPAGLFSRISKKFPSWNSFGMACSLTQILSCAELNALMQFSGKVQGRALKMIKFSMWINSSIFCNLKSSKSKLR